MQETICQKTNEFIAQMPKSLRKEYGQFFTSAETASFSISLNVKLSLESNTLVSGKKVVENRIGVKKLATSMANSDSGKFDFSFNDEKYSIFEGAGLDSSWRLSISDNLGLKKISDVIVYVSFTAKNS